VVLDIISTVAGVSIGIGVLLWVVQRFVSPHARSRHNDVAGFVYAVLGALYAVLLAFVVVDQWDNMETAKRNTFTEANELGALYWNARALPPAQGRDLERTTKQYATTVIDTEWPLLENGASSQTATNLVYTMRDEINAMPTGTPREQTIFDQSLSHVNGLEAARRQRLSESTDTLPPVLWVSLLVGSVLTVGFAFLFGLSNFVSHLLIAAPLGILVVMVLIVIDQLNHPFGGVVAVGPDAFHIFLSRLPAQR
jgi:Protein of unknown function (DUF4239)